MEIYAKRNYRVFFDGTINIRIVRLFSRSEKNFLNLPNIFSARLIFRTFYEFPLKVYKFNQFDIITSDTTSFA